MIGGNDHSTNASTGAYRATNGHEYHPLFGVLGWYHPKVLNPSNTMKTNLVWFATRKRKELYAIQRYQFLLLIQRENLTPLDYTRVLHLSNKPHVQGVGSSIADAFGDQ